VPQAGGGRTRFRRSLGADVVSRTQAEEAEARIRAKLLAEQTRLTASPGTPESVPSAAFSGFAKKWYDTHVAVNLKPSTQESYGDILRVHLVPHFGDRAIATITALDVEQYKAAALKKIVPKTEKTIRPKTVNEHLCVLGSMMEAAVRWGYLSVNPCRRVRRLRVPQPELHFYDAEQTERFLAAAREIEPDYAAFFTVAFKTGMRLGEILALEWSDLDFGRRQIRVRHSFRRGKTSTPKSHKIRVVPMNQSANDAFKSVRHLKGVLVFSRRDGTHLTRDMIKRPYERVIAAAKLPPLAAV